MFKRRRSQRVHPDVLIQDAYIKRRYEDLSVCIHKDIKNGQGRYNYYAPWLELKLQSFPAFYREKHSVLDHNLPVVAETSDTPQNITRPSTFMSGNEPMNGVPKNAWIQEEKDNKVGTESKPMCTPINKAQTSEITTTPNHLTEDRGNSPRVDVVSEVERVEAEEVVQEHNVTIQKSQTNRVTFPDKVDQEEIAGIQETKSTQPSLPVARSGSSVSSRLCTIL